MTDGDVTPQATRPFMPGYGIDPAHAGHGLLPWSWALERLRSSHEYWLATTWPDGGPHVMPVWGVWRDGALWFSSGLRSRKATNLAHDPRCVLTTDDARHPVVEPAHLLLEPGLRLDRHRAAVGGQVLVGHAVDDLHLGRAPDEQAAQRVAGIDRDRHARVAAQRRYLGRARDRAEHELAAALDVGERDDARGTVQTGVGEAHQWRPVDVLDGHRVGEHGRDGVDLHGGGSFEGQHRGSLGREGGLMPSSLVVAAA